MLGIVDLRIFDISGLVPDHVGAHFESEIAEVPAIGDPSFDTALAAAVVILVRNEHTTAEHAGQLRGTPRNLVETQRVEIVDLTRECMAEERELHADVDVVPLHPRNGGITPLERHQSVLAGSVAVVVVGTRIVNIRVDVVRHARIGFRIGIRNLDFQIIQPTASAQELLLGDDPPQTSALRVAPTGCRATGRSNRYRRRCTPPRTWSAKA